MKCLRKDKPKKSLVNGNPLYKEIPHTGGKNIQGEPLVNIRGNRLQREINYTRKPLIHGNSCKVNALFNKGAHPRPSLFEESSVHLNISKTSGKPKKPKQPKRSRQQLSNTIENTNTNKQTNMFRPMSAKVDMGLKVLFVVFCLVLPMVLIVVALTSLVVLVSLVFPVVFDVFKCLHCMFKRVPGTN